MKKINKNLYVPLSLLNIFLTFAAVMFLIIRCDCNIISEKKECSVVTDPLEKVDSIKMEHIVTKQSKKENRIKKVENSIILYKYGISDKTIFISYENASEKTIKCTRFNVCFYDSSCQPISDYLGNYSICCEDTYMNNISSNSWKYTSFYSAKDIGFDKIEIEYTDGTKLLIGPNELKYIKGYRDPLKK